MNEREIFIAALEIDDPSDRQAYIDRTCVGSPELRSRLRQLLNENERLGNYLEDSPVELSVEASTTVDDSGSVVGRYRLLEKIDEGGFGNVYMADQTEPVRRRVALKIVKPGMDTSEVIARFEAERQALAAMDHPNITRVLETGQTDSGRPYFVMELVKGVALTEYCDEHLLSTNDRLKLFTQICHAVQHAHQKGIIHRDLKPSNVMVTLHNGDPVPKIIDFGISKALSQTLTEKTLFTRYGQFVGTPQYMSPEQAALSGQDVDTRSDVYSLGILLYELLTGQPAFSSEMLRGVGLESIRRIICETDPPRPSHLLRTLDEKASTTIASRRSTQPLELCRQLRGDLDWIVMKAIDKDRDRRYATAENLAADVGRYLVSEPISARPPTVMYTLQKTFLRHRRAVVAAGVALAVLFLATGISTFGLVKARRQSDRAMRAEQDAMAAKLNAERNEQIALRREADANRDARRASLTLKMLLDLIAQPTINFMTGQEATVSDLTKRLNTAVSGLPESEPDLAAAAYLALGRIAVSREERSVAAEYLSRCRDLLQINRSSRPDELAACLRYLAYAQGSVDELTQVAEIERAANGVAHFKTLTLLGALLLRDNEHQAAQRVLEAACQSFDDSDRSTLPQEVPWLHLTRALEAQGKSKQAALSRERSVAIFKRQFSADFDVWSVQGWWLRFDVNRYCSKVFVQVAEDFAIVDNRPLPINLARFYRSWGDLAKAQDAAQDVIDRSTSESERKWGIVELARIAYDVYDLDEAYHRLEEARVEYAKRNLLADVGCEPWCVYDMARVARYRDEPTPVPISLLNAQVADTLSMDVHQPITEWPVSTVQSTYAAAAAQSGRDVDYGELLDHAREALSVSGDYLDLYAHVAAAIINEEAARIDDAIDAYVEAARARYYHEHAFVGWVEDRLVELLVETEQIQRAESLLREFVSKRDQELEPADVERAFGMMRLATFLMEHRPVDSGIEDLLLKSDALLSQQPLVPKRIRQELRTLLAEARAAG